MISTEILETKGPNIVRRIHLNARILPLTSKIWCRCWCCGRNLQAIRIVIQFACALKSWNDRIERSTLSVWRSEAHLILERRRFHLARCEYANSVDTVDTTHTHTHSASPTRTHPMRTSCTFNIYVGLCGAFVAHCVYFPKQLFILYITSYV